MYTITIRKELDFNDLFNECWSGAVDTLRTISENNKEDELMSLLALDVFGDMPDLTEVNDLLWFDDAWVFEMLGINNDDDDDDDSEDEDDD